MEREGREREVKGKRKRAREVEVRREGDRREVEEIR